MPEILGYNAIDLRHQNHEVIFTVLPLLENLPNVINLSYIQR